ncbi:MAG: hypothetical protein HC921_10495 [Synechococcaceae cyanobacterium SM2_3_1]|nr:hypothetical protein [Synechococcaceae cyanobacterium SM2_3_1]
MVSQSQLVGQPLRILLISGAGLLVLLGGDTVYSLPLQASATGTYLAQVATVKAPLGNYSATLGSTLRSQRVLGSEVANRRTRQTEVGAGQPISITLASYSTPEQLQQIIAAPAGNRAATLNQYNHGTVTIAGLIYPINAATSFQWGGNYVVNLMSARPFAAVGSEGQVAQLNTVGYITLLLPTSGGPGSGKLYTSTQANLTESGQVQVVRGASTATDLINVTLNSF